MDSWDWFGVVVYLSLISVQASNKRNGIVSNGDKMKIAMSIIANYRAEISNLKAENKTLSAQSVNTSSVNRGIDQEFEQDLKEALTIAGKFYTFGFTQGVKFDAEMIERITLLMEKYKLLSRRER